MTSRHAAEDGVTGEGTARRLILWDIDGTLIKTGPVGEEVFVRALVRALGTPPSQRVQMSGKTDPQIILEYLALAAVADPDHWLSPILGHLEAETAQARPLFAERSRVLPGVLELLPALHADARFLQSVLTGNIRPNALVKLGAFGLERWLDLEVGAYGSDDHDRCGLVPIALARATRVREVSFEPEQVWVVGDSANDLACARAAGARCLLVATGRAGLDELSQLGATATLADLGDVDAVVRLLAE
ncbi:MAG TPA: HAD family hydrolase [Candidatus Binatia bacterium]|nr:HAD family hydrolase [Candidatus Binatia bacterium]